jgi:K+ transporter
MNFIKKIGWFNLLMLVLCFIIIIIAECLFLSGNKLHGIFIGLWAPTLLGVLIYLKLIEHERR